MSFTALRQSAITRQILFFVGLCLVIAEILIFIPSATQFQHRWFATQWQHFLMQFEPDEEANLPALNVSYERMAALSNTQFHAPHFVCWKDTQGRDQTLGHLDIEAVPFDLARAPLRQIPLV